MLKIGIVDEPVAPGELDELDITIHSASLIDYINHTSTPITVGIQGEWGSGKTSLINSIHHAFHNQERVKQIWINSWEYSLLSTPEESLLKIVNRIIEELIEADPDQARVDKIKGGAEKIFKGALRVGASIALGNEAASVAKELLDPSAQSISELRQLLTSVVNEMAARSSNPYEKVIIYVDDLDRIEPKNAVAILELLKNIFSIPKCVFILAIDYQVVVKGLEHKFGKQTPENEWEFRAFFDKIIQLPFMMPMGQYNIGKYVNSLLISVDFIKSGEFEEGSVREIVFRTIGGNPRSIKRLVNSVSLIQIFVKNKQKLEAKDGQHSDLPQTIEPVEQKFLLFSLLCLQIAYPYVYELLTKQPDFTSWDDEFAFAETKRSEEDTEGVFSTEFQHIKKTNDFDEEWEQALYRVCYNRPRLKPRLSEISQFFGYILNEVFAEKQNNVGSAIAHVLTQTSVTSVTSTDQGQALADAIKSQPNQGISIVADKILEMDPNFQFKGIHSDYISSQQSHWPSRLEFQIITRKRQNIFFVQIGAEKKAAKKVADRFAEILALLNRKIPNENWQIGPWYSEYDNRVFSEVPISDPDKAASLYLELVAAINDDVNEIVKSTG